MSNAKVDLVAIGNALVDVLAPATEGFLAAEEAKNGMMRGGMMLIDEARAMELSAAIAGNPKAVQMSGGCAGNTLAGFASFGGKGASIGKVAGDELGEIFRRDLRTQGVEVSMTALAQDIATGRCLIFVSDDGQRTMNTFLGAANQLGPQDIDRDLIASASVTYLEGYLFDPPHAKDAFRLAAKTAHDAGRKVSLTLSDSFCVNRHRDDFLQLVQGDIDILFANETEIMALYQTTDFNAAIKQVAGHCEVAAVTRGAAGSVIVTKDKVIEVTASPVAKVVDTTGAGDQYAAGFLYGYTQGMALDVCGRLGSLAAAEVIGHMGPRPEISYAEFVRKAAA